MQHASPPSSAAVLLGRGAHFPHASAAWCLLLLPGAGAGKSTLLKILGGKHMVAEGAVSVLGRPPFHDTQLTISGDLAYVGGTWTRDIAFAGTSVPLSVSSWRSVRSSPLLGISAAGPGNGARLGGGGAACCRDDEVAVFGLLSVCAGRLPGAAHD